MTSVEGRDVITFTIAVKDNRIARRLFQIRGHYVWQETRERKKSYEKIFSKSRIGMNGREFSVPSRNELLPLLRVFRAFASVSRGDM